MELLNHNENDHPYQCEICDKRFSRNWSLKKHVKTVHEGVKNHQCRICNKSFGTLSNLKRHLKSVHEKKKDFQCNLCNKTFSRKINLMNHKIEVHKIHLVCQTCYQNFIDSNSDVNFPMEIIHNENCICQNIEIQD